jgi:hypothetical protein
MTITEVVKHPLFVAIASLIVGALVASFVNRIRSRMARIRYFVTVNRVGITTMDPVFGNIKVAWNNQELPNLHIATVSFENISNVDIGELDLKVYTEERTRLLSERTSVTGTSYIVPQSDSYQRSLAVQPEGAPSELQWRIYFTSREYHLKALNRFQKAQLTYLCTRPNDDQVPAIWLESSTKGVHVKQIRNPAIGSRPLLGVPIAKAAILGLITAAIVSVVSILFVSPGWLVGLICLLTGLFASLLGSIEYKVYDSIKKRLST